MQNFILIFTFSILDLFCKFVQKSIWHFGVAWLVSQYISRRDLKPVAFLVWFKKSLKLVSAIFHFFSLFHLKSSFCYQDIQISSQFYPVSHWLRGCLKIILKFYDVGYCLNKNLITHFVWYLEKGKDVTLKHCQLIEYWV